MDSGGEDGVLASVAAWEGAWEEVWGHTQWGAKCGQSRGLALCQVQEQRCGSLWSWQR